MPFTKLRECSERARQKVLFEAKLCDDSEFSIDTHRNQYNIFKSCLGVDGTKPLIRLGANPGLTPWLTSESQLSTRVSVLGASYAGRIYWQNDIICVNKNIEMESRVLRVVRPKGQRYTASRELEDMAEQKQRMIASL